jgi:lysophospholipase L1-like esterase
LVSKIYINGGKFMKNVMIFGDSNTWGWDPSNDLVDVIKRWPDEVRWAGVLQQELGGDYTVEPLYGMTRLKNTAVASSILFPCWTVMRRWIW